MKKKITIFGLLALIGWSNFVQGQSTTVVEVKLSTMPLAGMSPILPNSTVNGKIYMFGLQLPPYSGTNTASKDIRTYDISSNTWAVLPFQLPYGIFDYAKASYYNNHFYFGSGFTTGNGNGFGSHNKMIDVNLSNSSATETTKAFYTGSIWNISSLEANGNIYFFGGYYYPAPIKKNFKYDPLTSSMQEVASFVNSRHNVSPFMGNDGWIYCFAEFTNTIERYNPTTNQVQLMKDTTAINVPAKANFAWNITSQNAIYYFAADVNNPIVYKYDYLQDKVTNTGIVMNGKYHARGVSDSANPAIIYGLKENTNNLTPYDLVKLTLCTTRNVNDTITYFVSSPKFNSISPKIVFESTENLTTKIGGCDSIIQHYSKFVYNPTYCSVTDTLIIDIAINGLISPNNMNTIKIYPNPAHSYVIIDTGDYSSMADYTVKIENLLGQQVYSTLINQAKFQINVNSFGGYGTYIVKIIDNKSNVITTKKILLH